MSETPSDTETSVTVDVETLAVEVADLRPALEAILMVADQALDKVQLASVVGHPVEAVDEALQTLAGEYTEQGRGFELRNVAGGWRFYTRDEFAGVVESFVLEGQQARLTQAALETLAVVAYKQPVSRARVSAVRGVSVDGVMRTLLTRGLVEEAGQDVETGANLYRTTTYFLDRIGITSLEELPELAPYLPDMEDLEDELTQMAAPTPEPVPDAGARRRAGRRQPRTTRPRTAGWAPNPTAGPRSHEAARREGHPPRVPASRHRRGRADPAAEAAGPVGRRQPSQVRGADARGRRRGRRRGRHPARHQGRPAHRGDPRRGPPAAADQRLGLPRAQQAPRRRLDDERPRGTPHPGRPGRRPSRAALPRRVGSTPTPRGC